MGDEASLNRKLESFDELKRSIFLWIGPCIVIALIINTLLQNIDISRKFDLTINTTLSIWFVISWVLFYKRCFTRFAEYSNLALISVYQVTTFFDVVRNYISVSGGSLGDFIIWMPMITLLFFLILGTRRGLYFSIFIFMINFAIGIMYISSLSSESIDSLVQYYLANLVYIIVLYYAQHIFKTYADLEMFKKHAFIDSLTRIANRLQIDGWLEKNLKVFNEKGEHFSIIFFDIDHFKEVNDNYGHKVGDEVLIELAELVQSQLSEHELFGRWGGEEFIIISAESAKDAAKLAEHLRSVIETNHFNEVGSITGSFGVTHAQPGDSLVTLLNRADNGLYKSKKLGRNRVSYID